MAASEIQEQKTHSHRANFDFAAGCVCVLARCATEARRPGRRVLRSTLQRHQRRAPRRGISLNRVSEPRRTNLFQTPRTARERPTVQLSRAIRQSWKPAFALPSTSTHRENNTMPTGTVKWFNATKSYGFIAPKDGSKDAFVHIFAVERAGRDNG